MDYHKYMSTLDTLFLQCASVDPSKTKTEERSDDPCAGPYESFDENMIPYEE